MEYVKSMNFNVNLSNRGLSTNKGNMISLLVLKHMIFNI